MDGETIPAYLAIMDVGESEVILVFSCSMCEGKQQWILLLHTKEEASECGFSRDN